LVALLGPELVASHATERQRPALSRLMVWPHTNDAAAQFGHVFAELRRLGRPMQPVDFMAAAIAFSLGNSTVMAVAADLEAVPGLAIENWAEGGPRRR
jgi:tRNA(fMet)-specific endonuclease VapC